VAEHEEVLGFIDAQDLSGKGLDYVDVNLLESTLISGLSLWTLDKKLDRAAARLRCCYESH
jgi:hypothetical protein